MKVYVDFLFLINFVIDGLMLVGTAWIRKVSIRLFRIIAAASIGASFVFVIFVPSFSMMFHFTTKVFISLIMVWVAVGYGGWQRYSKHVAAFYSLNFITAGGVIGFQQMLDSQSELLQQLNETMKGGISIPIQVGIGFTLLAMAPLVWLIRQVITTREKTDRIEKWIIPMEIHLEGQVISCRGLIDTGNQLFEPLTGVPVIVSELQLWLKTLPTDVCNAIENNNFQVELGLFSLASRIRFIPYRGIGNDVQLMAAIRPDFVKINGVITERVIVGIKPTQLHHENAYQTILHPELLHS